MQRSSITPAANHSAVALARDRAFWVAHSGISEGARDDAVAPQGPVGSSTLTVTEVAEKLHLSAPTVRRRTAVRRLYSYRSRGRLVFPDWQFIQPGDQTLPGLDRVLAALPDDLHPPAIAGFFLTPQPDLVVNGNAASVTLWLEKGGSVDPVVSMARELAAGSGY